jgi:hypothetical protein
MKFVSSKTPLNRLFLHFNLSMRGKSRRFKQRAERGRGHEARRAKEAVGDYDLTNSRSLKTIPEHYGEVCHKELLAIAEVLVHHFGLPEIKRDHRRILTVLYKWFDDNWAEIEPRLRDINLHDMRKNPIQGQ